MDRFTRPALFSVSHVGNEHECEDSNPMRQFWRLRALPGARSCEGCSNGIEPSLSASQADVQSHYTTNTMKFIKRKARDSNPDLL